MNDCKNKNYISEKVYHKTQANANIYSEILFVFLLLLNVEYIIFLCKKKAPKTVPPVSEQAPWDVAIQSYH